jgi:broad specificity phosphatase PhoE
MIQRLEPVITEMEREGQSIVIVAHQAVLRILYGYLTARPQVGGGTGWGAGMVFVLDC